MVSEHFVLMLQEWGPHCIARLAMSHGGPSTGLLDSPLYTGALGWHPLSQLRGNRESGQMPFPESLCMFTEQPQTQGPGHTLGSEWLVFDQHFGIG